MEPQHRGGMDFDEIKMYYRAQSARNGGHWPAWWEEGSACCSDVQRDRSSTAAIASTMVQGNVARRTLPSSSAWGAQ